MKKGFVINKAPYSGVVLKPKYKNPIFELRVRSKDPSTFNAETLSAIHKKIADGEQCGWGNGYMWEIVQKEAKDARQKEARIVEITGKEDVNLYMLAWTVMTGFFELYFVLMRVSLPGGKRQIGFPHAGTTCLYHRSGTGVSRVGEAGRVPRPGMLRMDRSPFERGISAKFGEYDWWGSRPSRGFSHEE